MGQIIPDALDRLRVLLDEVAEAAPRLSASMPNEPVPA